jgi:hypothetical protein
MRLYSPGVDADLCNLRQLPISPVDLPPDFSYPCIFPYPFLPESLNNTTHIRSGDFFLRSYGEINDYPLFLNPSRINAQKCTKIFYK